MKIGIAKRVKLENESIIIELACVKLTIGSKIIGITDAIIILNATGTPINKHNKNMNKTQKSIIYSHPYYSFYRKALLYSQSEIVALTMILLRKKNNNKPVMVG